MITIKLQNREIKIFKLLLQYSEAYKDLHRIRKGDNLLNRIYAQIRSQQNKEITQ